MACEHDSPTVDRVAGWEADKTCQESGSPLHDMSNGKTPLAEHNGAVQAWGLDAKVTCQTVDEGALTAFGAIRTSRRPG